MRKIALVLLMTSLIMVGCTDKVEVNNLVKENEIVEESKAGNENEDAIKNEEVVKNEDAIKNEEAIKSEEITKNEEKSEVNKIDENVVPAQSAVITPTEVAVKDESIHVSKFIPNGSYVFTNSTRGDIYSYTSYVKGNGTRFQEIIGTSKCDVVTVYEVQGDNIVKIYKQDIWDNSGNETSNYLNVAANMNEVILKGPVKVGTGWDGKAIVEVGNKLNMNGANFNGAYAKVWGKDGSSEYGYTFIEGLGKVRMFSKIGESYMSELSLKSYISS